MKRKQNKIAAFILNFCNEISTETPVLVPRRPLPGKPYRECFNIVPEHILTNGGEQRFGWCIHIWKKVLIEAEFHCVWENPSGELIDLTPNRDKKSFIVFLPAPDKKYDGRQVNNIRKALSLDPDVKRLISLYDEFFRYMNQGALADQYGVIRITDGRLSKLAKLMSETEGRLKAKYGNHRASTA